MIEGACFFRCWCHLSTTLSTALPSPLACLGEARHSSISVHVRVIKPLATHGRGLSLIAVKDGQLGQLAKSPVPSAAPSSPSHTRSPPPQVAFAFCWHQFHLASLFVPAGWPQVSCSPCCCFLRCRQDRRGVGEARRRCTQGQDIQRCWPFPVLAHLLERIFP